MAAGPRPAGQHAPEPAHRPAMRLETKLDEWQAAGLIDSAVATAIRAHEQHRPEAPRRPVLAWALTGLGLLAVTLGVLLLVAANWDRIPDALKLGAHLALTAGAAALVATWLPRGRHHRSEAALLLLSALTLAGLSLHAQVYQLAGPLWTLLLPWALLMAPALLLAGRTRLAGGAMAAQLLAATVALAFDRLDGQGWWLQAHALAMATPPLLIWLSLPRLPFHAAVRLGLRDAGIVALLAAASFAHFRWAADVSAADVADMGWRLPLPLAVTGLAMRTAWRHGGLPRPLIAPLLLGPALAVVLALAVPHADHWGWRLAGVLAFALMWGWIALGAWQSGWSALFAVSIAALGIRIFIVYIELFGSLAATGGGLVAGGLLLIGLAFAWRRIVARAGVGA